MKTSETNRALKVAAVQIRTELHNRKGTIKRVVNEIRELGKRDVRFDALTELEESVIGSSAAALKPEVITGPATV